MENGEVSRLEWPLGEQEPAELYIELLKRTLTGLVRPQLYAQTQLSPAISTQPVFQELLTQLENDNLEIVQRVTRTVADRVAGLEWIPDCETMVGLYRLDNVHHCIRDVIKDNVPGDVIETGVWRGGTCILMRGCLKAYRDDTRKVWVADSFKGLPPPDELTYPADSGDQHFTYHELAIPREVVEENFRNYGLLDDRVKFLEGWFKDTLPSAPIEQLAVMRLDGDMYESTMDALNALYHKLSPGGYAIIDDYLWHKPCAQAVEEFRAKHQITEPIKTIDRCGVFWRRER